MCEVARLHSGGLSDVAEQEQGGPLQGRCALGMVMVSPKGDHFLLCQVMHKNQSV